MPTLPSHFKWLLKRIEPSANRVDDAKRYTAAVRDFLRDRQKRLKVVDPHTRLAGSYARDTAILDINDVDVLAFIDSEYRGAKPAGVLSTLAEVLNDYPDAAIEVDPQRRSVRLELKGRDFRLDIVPSVLDSDLDSPLFIPDRPQAEWIKSDPLGYGRTLTDLNKDNGGKVVPLVKLIKAWRDEQMKIRRPKSYTLEAMVVCAIRDKALEFEDKGYAEILHGLFAWVEDSYGELMDSGAGVPKVPDPQLKANYVTKGWERSHFETFMRRAREGLAASESALDEKNEQEASKLWAKVFLTLWPSDAEAEALARAEAIGQQLRSGPAVVTSKGHVAPAASGLTGVAVPPTSYHGGK